MAAKAAADIRVDKIDADGFIFDLDFILRRIGRSELYGLKYFRATVLGNSIRVAMCPPERIVRVCFIW